MAFWSVEVEPGKSHEVQTHKYSYFRLAHAVLSISEDGEKDDNYEDIYVYVKIGDGKRCLGSLNRRRCVKMDFNLHFHLEFELSHSSRYTSYTSVYFYGFRSTVPKDYALYYRFSSCLLSDSDTEDWSDEEEREREKCYGYLRHWSAKVNPGCSPSYTPNENCVFHLSQAAYIPEEDDKPFYIYVSVPGCEKEILGTLSASGCHRIQFDLYFNEEFKLSHSSSKASVYFLGYETAQPAFSINVNNAVMEPWNSLRYWSLELKPGCRCAVVNEKYCGINLVHASLGRSDDKENLDKGDVLIYMKTQGSKKSVIGTLSASKCTQINFAQTVIKDFELFHTSKNASVYFFGYESFLVDQFDVDAENEFNEEEVPDAQNTNGKLVVKQEGKTGAGKANAVVEDNSAAKIATEDDATVVDEPMAEDENEYDGNDYGENDSDKESNDDKARMKVYADNAMMIEKASTATCIIRCLSIEVKPGDYFLVRPGENRQIFITQAAFEPKEDDEPIYIYVKVGGLEKSFLGTLSASECTQILFDLRSDEGFVLTHTSNKASVYFLGYDAAQPRKPYTKSVVNGNWYKPIELIRESVISYRSFPATHYWRGYFFWSVKVKPGRGTKYTPEEDMIVNLSQASLGKSKVLEDVRIYVEVNGVKSVLGILSPGKCTQITFNLNFDKKFRLSHSSTSACVYFFGYENCPQAEYGYDRDWENELEEVTGAQQANGDGKSDASKKRTCASIESLELDGRNFDCETVVEADKKAKHDLV